MNHLEYESEIIVGTYEDYVVGYQVETVDKPQGSARKRVKTGESKSNGTIGNGSQASRVSHVSLEQTFASRSHSGSVRCLSVSNDGVLVFSSGQDETMNLFNLAKRKLLETSHGPITEANFVEGSHLICGSEDGNIYIYHCKSSGMKLLKSLRGHKASIVSIDTHPSGKVLLSLSRDQTMRTWNLIKGRCSYVTNLKTEAHLVRWSKSGDEFMIAADKDIHLYNKLGGLKASFSFDKRVNSFEFLRDDLFVVAIDSGKLNFFSNIGDDCKSILNIDAHESRIKSIKCLIKPKFHSELDPDERLSSRDELKESTVQLATASSDGIVKLWSVDYQNDTKVALRELACVDVGARLTCMMTSVRRISV